MPRSAVKTHVTGLWMCRPRLVTRAGMLLNFHQNVASRIWQWNTEKYLCLSLDLDSTILLCNTSLSYICSQLTCFINNGIYNNVIIHAVKKYKKHWWRIKDVSFTHQHASRLRHFCFVLRCYRDDTWHARGQPCVSSSERFIDRRTLSRTHDHCLLMRDSGKHRWSSTQKKKYDIAL